MITQKIIDKADEVNKVRCARCEKKIHANHASIFPIADGPEDVKEQFFCNDCVQCIEIKFEERGY